MLEFLTGTGLATSAGLNAYIPLLALGLLDRFTGLVDLPAGWTWLSADASLWILGALLALELVADKIPGVDAVNDVVQTVVGADTVTVGAAAPVLSAAEDVSAAGLVAAALFLPVLVAACASYRQLGVFNCLLSDGDWLFSFCSTKLAHITRRAPFGPAQLKDADLKVDFQSETTPNDVVTVIATEPLTDNEQWARYQPGEWRLWRRGECITYGKA